MTGNPWPPGAATGVGSMPGTDPLEAAKTVVGELPELPYLPELPARGLGADMIGRTAALLVDLAVEEVTSGYRVAARAGRDQNRAVSLLRTDLDAFEQALELAGARPQVIKVQAAGPWTLAAGVELRNGHRVLTDDGAVREVTASLAEGLALHADELARRTGARVVVQLDEPSLPAVLAGRLPTPSGYGTEPAIEDADAQVGLRTVLDALAGPRIVHCCAANPPIELLRRAGADALGIDLTLVTGNGRAAAGAATRTGTVDAIGQAWEDGATLLLGVVPATEPDRPVTLRDVARPAFQLADRLGFPRATLAQRVVPTPACGLAGATPRWARRALALVRDTGRAFVEPPEGW
ncbi:MAG TPA: methionine synthase [Pseudonocardiaceae bacterium]|jgi:methionine synthase II (cobalamin-independent)